MVPGVASAKVDDPGISDAGCVGRVIAWFNRNSGTTENNSRGPGSSFRDGQAVTDAINKHRAGAVRAAARVAVPAAQ
jgi:hypothetical protein